jgi:hypothetical protein
VCGALHIARDGDRERPLAAGARWPDDDDRAAAGAISEAHIAADSGEYGRENRS